MKLNILLTLLFIFFISPAMAQDETTTTNSLNIAVIDVQQLMNESKAAKSIQSQGKDLVKKYQKEISKLEDNLKDAEKEVVDAQKAQDKEKFMESRQSFQKELMESQKEIQSLNQKKDKAVADALNTLRDEIIEIVNEMTVDRGYDLVITRADIVTVSKDIDITADVMKQLNKQLKSVKVKG